MINYKIYALKIIHSDNIKYIGYTSRDISTRLYEHFNITINLKYKNGMWIKKHKNDIEIILIEDNIRTHEEACEREKYYIKYYKEIGHDLNNLTDGGDGVLATEETRRKISESQKGKIVPIEQREKISKTLKGRHLSDETKNKISLIKTGITLSNETRQKISRGLIGRHLSDDTKRKISESNKGKHPHNKGIPMSEFQKNKISKSNKGNPTINSRKIDVFIYKTNEYVATYDYITECIEKLQLKSNHINDVLIGKRKQSYGYTFKLSTI